MSNPQVCSEYCCCCCHDCCCCHQTGKALSKCRQAKLVNNFTQNHQNYCHKRMNEQFAVTGRNFKEKDNRIQLRSQQKSRREQTSHNGDVAQEKLEKNPEQAKTNAKSHHLPRKQSADLNLIKNIYTKSDNLVSHMCKNGNQYDFVQKRSDKAKLQNYSKFSDHCLRISRTGFTRNINGGFYRR